MPIRTYECSECGNQKTTGRGVPVCEHGTDAEGDYRALIMKEVVTAPSSKFMEPRDTIAKERGKSVMKNSDKILRARARNHARDHDLPELVLTNDRNFAKQNRWINDKGQIRKKIDDI